MWFVAGYCTGQENGKNIILSQYKLLHNDYDAKTELVSSRSCTDAADHVMGKNELFDTDRSDEMVNILDLAHGLIVCISLGSKALCLILLPILCLREHKEHL